MIEKLYKEIKKRISLLNTENGQGLMEYSLILLLISIAAIATMTPVGARIAVLFGEVVGKI